MRNEIIENREFCILSRSIDNAEKCTVVEVFEDSFKVKLNSIQVYEKNESVELFAMTSNGQLYFETLVKEVDGDILTIWFPITYKYLQRREFSRIALEKEVVLEKEKEEINAKMVDISAGGLKLVTQKQLKMGPS